MISAHLSVGLATHTILIMLSHMNANRNFIGLSCHSEQLVLRSLAANTLFNGISTRFDGLWVGQAARKCSRQWRWTIHVLHTVETKE
jgi:hypothetical protein